MIQKSFQLFFRTLIDCKKYCYHTWANKDNPQEFKKKTCTFSQFCFPFMILEEGDIAILVHETT